MEQSNQQTQQIKEYSYDEFMNTEEEILPHECLHIKTVGKNKGDRCNKPTLSGYDKCRLHQKEETNGLWAMKISYNNDDYTLYKNLQKEDFTTILNCNEVRYIPIRTEVIIVCNADLLTNENRVKYYNHRASTRNSLEHTVFGDALVIRQYPSKYQSIQHDFLTKFEVEQYIRLRHYDGNLTEDIDRYTNVFTDEISRTARYYKLTLGYDLYRDTRKYHLSPREIIDKYWSYFEMPEPDFVEDKECIDGLRIMLNIKLNEHIEDINDGAFGWVIRTMENKTDTNIYRTQTE